MQTRRWRGAEARGCSWVGGRKLVALMAVFAPGCLEETDAGCREQEEAGMALPRWSRQDLCFVPLLAEHRSCF